MFDVNTMKAFRVTAKIAGMESTAKSRSVVSTASSTSASGVSARREPIQVRKRSPSKAGETGRNLSRQAEDEVFLRPHGCLPGNGPLNSGQD